MIKIMGIGVISLFKKTSKCYFDYNIDITAIFFRFEHLVLTVNIGIARDPIILIGSWSTISGMY